MEINEDDHRRITNRLGDEEVLLVNGPDRNALEVRQSSDRSLTKSLKNSIKLLNTSYITYKLIIIL